MHSPVKSEFRPPPAHETRMPGLVSLACAFRRSRPGHSACARSAQRSRRLAPTAVAPMSSRTRKLRTASSVGTPDLARPEYQKNNEIGVAERDGLTIKHPSVIRELVENRVHPVRWVFVKADVLDRDRRVPHGSDPTYYPRGSPSARSRLDAARRPGSLRLPLALRFAQRPSATAHSDYSPTD